MLSVNEVLNSNKTTYIEYQETYTCNTGEVIDLNPIFNAMLENYTAETGLKPNPSKAATYRIVNPTDCLRFYIDSFNRFHASHKPYDYDLIGEGYEFTVEAKTTYINPSSQTQPTRVTLIFNFTITVVPET